MKRIRKIKLVVILLVFFANYAIAQQKSNQETSTSDPTLKTYLIERDIPGAENLTAEQLKGISQKSCAVLNEMGPNIEWLHSYIADDKVYCIYKAESVELIKEHARKGKFPVHGITEVATKIGPATVEN